MTELVDFRQQHRLIALLLVDHLFFDNLPSSGATAAELQNFLRLVVLSSVVDRVGH